MMLMKNGRYLIKKIIKMCIFTVLSMIGMTFVMGFNQERNIYQKLDNITIELGDKLPEEIINYLSILTNKTNLLFGSDIPLDKNGNTMVIGNFNYYLVHNNYKLTNTKATITVKDTIKPIINIKKNQFAYGSKLNVYDIATCHDLSGCKMYLKEDIDTNKSGEYEINITAYDGANNISYAKTKITILKKPTPTYDSSIYFQNMNNHNNNKNTLLSEEEKESLRQKVASFAKNFIGNPYVLGGTSLTNGADCSGFTMSIYANFGYTLPRISTYQAYVGKRVSENELKPGDIVVYLYEGHVGIYVGNGMMVHASTPKGGILYAKMYPGYRVYQRIIY